MGWTWTRLNGTTMKNYIRARALGPKLEVLDDAIVNRQEYYAAVRHNDRVVAVVILVRFIPNARDGLTFGYKDMDESALPYYFRCPERILKLLTDPPPNDNAKRWREECWKRVRTKIKRGQVIEFKEPICFIGSGDCYRRFVHEVRNIFRVENTAARVRISNWKEREHTIHEGP